MDKMPNDKNLKKIPTFIFRNKLQGRVKIENRCQSAHKYRRFSKKNKTFRTDLYFCANCGHTRKIEMMFGVMTRCWKCNEPFEIGVKLPIFPICEKCKGGNNLDPATGKRILDHIKLDFLNDEENVEKEEKTVDSKKEFIEDTLKELGLK